MSEKAVQKSGCVPKRNGKFRSITDLTTLNSFYSPPIYKNDDVRDLAAVFKYLCKFISLDDKDEFYHIPVHPLDYLGFWGQVLIIGGRYYHLIKVLHLTFL